MSKQHYDVLIVGAGISGAALAYELARYTDCEHIAIVEKYDEVASLNSKGTSNSQTIHVGDIETNYTVQKAAITKRTAKMVEKYCMQYNYQDEIIFSHQKMALGVGEDEVEFLLQRYEEFAQLFPYLEVWDKEKLKEYEPRVVLDKDGNERPEPVVGIGARGEWTTVDYGKMSESLIENAKKQENTQVNLFLNQEVLKIEKSDDRGYRIHTNGICFSADFVVVNAGAHSLYLANKMGYGKELSCLPMAGSFYITKQKMLNGKVYMIQNDKLPFAALHGDPDVLADGNTRFGPTALMLPKLERYKGHVKSFFDFWYTLKFDSHVFKALWKLLRESDIRSYIFRNFLFEVPILNKRLFLKDAQKIVPSLKLEEFEYAEGFGGVRPQVIDKKEEKLMLGEASINTGDGILFNMTPSPGATSCLGNAERDIQFIMKYLGKTFDQDKFDRELTEGTYCVMPDPVMEQKLRANKIRQKMHHNETEYYCDIEHGKPAEEFWDTPHSKLN